MEPSLVGRNPLIRYVVVLAVGYVLGTKAGRRRYEQIADTYRALTSSPVAKSIIEGGRRKIANRISPDAGFVNSLRSTDHPQNPHLSPPKVPNQPDPSPTVRWTS